MLLEVLNDARRRDVGDKAVFFCRKLPVHARLHLYVLMRLSALLLLTIGVISCSSKPLPSRASGVVHAESVPASSPVTSPLPQDVGTRVVMHNVLLSESPGPHLQVRWLRGRMRPARPNQIPTFDEPSSFVLDIQDAVISTSLSDLSAALNGGMLKSSPLEHVSLGAQGQQLKLTGTLHKGIPLPFEMISDVASSTDGRIRMHIEKMRVLHVPVVALLKTFDLKAADLVSPKGARGVEVVGNDIYFDPAQILPQPRKQGKLTAVHIMSGSLVEVYGSAARDVERTAQWRNFLRLKGGTLGFGKLTMHNVDIAMIDVSNDAWFKFDLSHYQEQLVNGYTRITPQAGLQIFMPDIDKVPQTKANQKISLEWAKNRNLPPPPDVLRR